mmetsp:Transcript_15471/g.18633  ORF Transcript_15471/g.18633 Transcript_15471/m.18633 type:complete len:130 (+) Transcript_15471:570-959(+)
MDSLPSRSLSTTLLTIQLTSSLAFLRKRALPAWIVDGSTPSTIEWVMNAVRMASLICAASLLRTTMMIGRVVGVDRSFLNCNLCLFLYESIIQMFMEAQVTTAGIPTEVIVMVQNNSSSSCSSAIAYLF